MIAAIIHALFPIDDQPVQSRDPLWFWAFDMPRLARRIEPPFSGAIVAVTGGLVVMMIVRILAAWAAGRL